jgi:hypothetical protein
MWWVGWGGGVVEVKIFLVSVQTNIMDALLSGTRIQNPAEIWQKSGKKPKSWKGMKIENEVFIFYCIWLRE